MLSTLVLDAPAGSGGTGRVRASVRGCTALLTHELQLRGTGLPWNALPGVDREATGGALPTGAAANAAVRGTEQLAVPAIAQRPKAVVTGVDTAFASTTDPYTTLGIHPPGRPQS